MLRLLRRAARAIKVPPKGREALKEAVLLLRRGSASERRPPDFLVIGGQKCGSTTLYQHLSLHPNVVPALAKEIRYFDFNWRRGWGWYMCHFPRRSRLEATGGLLTGEASPSYIFDPYAPRRVKERLPDVKLVLIVRDPVTRAYSHYQHAARHWDETLGFAEAVAREPERLEGELERLLRDERYYGRNRIRYSYTTRGIYADQLARWLEYFPLERVLILKSEDYLQKTGEVFSQVCNFLGLPLWKPPGERIFNRARYAPMDEALRRRLYDFFAPHNRRFYKLAGRDFGWEENIN